MVDHPVAAKILMLALLGGGLFVVPRMRTEVFPEFELDVVNVSLPYPGASPEEVETGVLQAVEEAVRGLDGVKKVTSVAIEGQGSVRIELVEGSNGERARGDIESAINRIGSFPRDAERAVVTLLVNRRQVISLVLSGRVGEDALRGIAERARADLVGIPGITQVDLLGARRPEVRVEVPERALRQSGLTLERVAREIAATSVDVPAGALRTVNGDILVRTKEKRVTAADFATVPVLAGAGVAVSVDDVGDVKETYEDQDKYATFNDVPALRLQVYRTGESKPEEISTAVRAYAAGLAAELSPAVEVGIWDDQSKTLEARQDLLFEDACIGLLLIVLVMGLFLDLRVALWVAVGIPTSFLGGVLLLPLFGVSINMVSLFAFLIVSGLVVDDAIVIAENVFYHRQQGRSMREAAVLGVREVAAPVVFSVLTTMTAFVPILFVPGTSGKIFYAIPVIVISVLFVALIDTMFILPNHLAHLSEKPSRGLVGMLVRGQAKVLGAYDWLIERTYAPVARWVVRERYITAALGVALLIASFGWIGGGHIKFTFFPKTEQDVVLASIALPFGAPVTETEAVRQRVVQAALSAAEEHGGRQIIVGVYADVGFSLPQRGAGGGGGGGLVGPHMSNVFVQLVPSELRSVSSADFVTTWRKKTGSVAGVDTLVFNASFGGPGSSAAINVQLAHPSIAVLEEAGQDLAARLAELDGVRDIDDGFQQGKAQFDLTLRPEARALGITATELARQVRSAFFGAEAAREQRGRDEVRVMVSLPRPERDSEHDLSTMMLRTPAGGEIPLLEAAEVERGSAYTQIRRRDGKRVADVTADVDPARANANEVLASLAKGVLPGLMQRHPGLTWTYGGERESQNETLATLRFGFSVALVAIFVLLAIPLRNLIQPAIVMSAIPFGVVGALIGHWAHGFDLSIISVMGLVALTGVVVNDSLVLVDAGNEAVERGMTPAQAFAWAGVRRFRPIVLNSLTAFFGLIPMIYETSPQARFLIPMALSLGYGVMFSTFTTLVLVPAFSMIVEDVRAAWRWVLGQPERSTSTAVQGVDTTSP